jgi:hypothetical protein
MDVLLKLVNLINGHMRTPKIEALHRLINWINLKHNSSIPLLGIDTTPLSESSWLSGLIDADGNFYINWKLKKKGIMIDLIYYLRISQKQTYTRRLDPSVNVSNISSFSTPPLQVCREGVEKTYG